MRAYADLHLHASTENSLSELLGKAKELGYRLVGVSIPIHTPKEERKRLRDACKRINLDLAFRVDLTPKSPRELLEALRAVRRRFELVSVLCLSKAVARCAARDRRVDLLNFPPHPRGRFFDRSEAELASNSLSCLEIDMNCLLELRGASRARLISKLRRELKLAGKFGVPVVLSSGAKHPLTLRGPREYAALAHTLLDMGLEDALDAISETPKSIVERNREKLSPNFVAPGIRVVKVGGDCRGRSGGDT